MGVLMFRCVSRALLASLVTLTAACAVGTEDPTAAPAVEALGVAPASHSADTVCIQMVILCAEGYHAESVGHCRQVCVKNPPARPACAPTCGAGEVCTECRTIDGTGFFCLPEGSTC